MKKIALVAKREFLSRVKKKSFIIMTLLGPLLIAGFYGLVIYLSINGGMSNELKKTLVLDQSGLFNNKLEENEYYKFEYSDLPLEAARLKLKNEEYYALLQIAPQAGNTLKGFTLISEEQLSIKDKGFIEERLERVIQNSRYMEKGVDQNLVEEINDIDIRLDASTQTEEGLQTGTTEAATAIGYICAFIIYLFVLIYGIQVMRGVLEEKTNRIIEVVISSVKPFELMSGKILGIALVALLQFLLWIGLSALLSFLISSFFSFDMASANQSAAAAKEVGKAGFLPQLLLQLQEMNFVLILGMFLFYFISGYLFYGALFAAIGSAVDNETDTQQFMFPVTIPLFFSFMIAQSTIINNPHSAIATWMSMIPFTSPIIMVIRIPFGIPAWELLLSMFSMLAGIVFTTWLAGRIYRTGILLYGKKVSWRELWHWLFYKG